MSRLSLVAASGYSLAHRLLVAVISFVGEHRLQCSCLENPTDRGAWRATVHGIASVGHDLATKPPTTTDFRVHGLQQMWLMGLAALRQVGSSRTSD